MTTAQCIDNATRNRFRYDLPYPIAVNYKRIGACPESNPAKLMYILKTAEMAARLLGVITVAELRRGFAGKSLPDGPFRRDLPSRLAKPTFGTWLWIVREGVRTLADAKVVPFAEGLSTFCLDRDGKPSAAMRALNDLVTQRNRFMHDRVPPDEWLKPRELPRSCEESLPWLERALAAMVFLTDYPVAFVSPITVEKKRYGDPRYIKDMLVIAGCAEHFDVERESSEGICESGEVLLLDRQGRRYMNLDPLILYSDEGTEEKDAPDGGRARMRTGIWDVFVYNGRSAGGLSYLACNKGGELSSRESSAAEYIERGFAEIEAMFGTAEGGR